MADDILDDLEEIGAGIIGDYLPTTSAKRLRHAVKIGREKLNHHHHLQLPKWKRELRGQSTHRSVQARKARLG